MKNIDLSRLFGTHPNSTSNIAKRKRKQKRTLRIEELEGREMLSATPFEVDLGEPATASRIAEVQYQHRDTVAGSQDVDSPPFTSLQEASLPNNPNPRDRDVYNDLVSRGVIPNIWWEATEPFFWVFYADGFQYIYRLNMMML